MPNKFLSLLEHIGKDVEHGLEIVLPVAVAAEPYVSAIDPAVGAIFTTVVGVVAQTEQKFAAIGKQTGTGPQKLADATAVLGPIVQQAFAAAGKANDHDTIQGYINAVVGLLNAIPASQPVAK